MKKTDQFKSILFLTLSVLSLAYYALCVFFAHAGISWLWLWPLLAVFCLVRFFMIRKQFSPPRWIRILYRAALVLFLSAFVVIEGLIIREMSTVPPDGLDYVITLGAAIRNGVPTTPFRLRMETALEYMTDNPGTVCIASGGQGPEESMSEAACVREYLLQHGIAPGRVLTEDQSTDTEENIRNSFSYIPKGASVGIISNSFHLFRAELIAKIQGHETSGVPAVTYPILGPHYTVREFFAVVEILVKSVAGQ